MHALPAAAAVPCTIRPLLSLPHNPPADHPLPPSPPCPLRSLDNVIRSDQVIVMDAGLVAEIGPPSVLLANPNSAFSSLVDKTGAASAAALRKMAADFLAEVRTSWLAAGVLSLPACLLATWLLVFVPSWLLLPCLLACCAMPLGRSAAAASRSAIPQ